MDDLFKPPGAEWRRLDPGYLKLKLLMIGIVWPILIAAATVGLWFFRPSLPLWWIALAVGVVIWIWRFWRAPRVFNRWGYAETETDVYVTQGLFWREFSCVPYGRMQLVTLKAGPLERAFGVARVSMVTASSMGDADIPGLNAKDAAELRDRLIERGELLQAGI